MARAGRKRKEGHRQPDGRLKQPTKLSLNEMNARAIEKETAVVRMQPHRQGKSDPWLHSVLGRFCNEHGCSKETYEGVSSYASMKCKWSSAKGRPRGLENFTSRGSGEGPDEAQVRGWEARLSEVHRAIVAHQDFGGDGAFIMSQIHRLAVEHLEIRSDTPEKTIQMIRTGMGEVAALMGASARNPHPFRA